MRIEVFAQGFEAAQRRRLTRRVAVHRQRNALGQLVEQGGVGIGQCGSHRGNHVAKAILMCHHHVHVALDNHNVIPRPNRVAALMQPIQQIAFIE